jgi:hypothetical protein
MKKLTRDRAAAAAELADARRQAADILADAASHREAARGQLADADQQWGLSVSLTSAEWSKQREMLGFLPH